MNNDTGLFALKQYRPGDTIRYINKTTAVFIKYKNGNQLNFFTKIIEDLSSPGSHSVLKKLHYGEIPLGFNGLVLYYTFGLTFINGYHFTNGVVDKTVTLSANNPDGTPTINSLHTNVTSTCDVYPIYQIQCTTGTAPNVSVNQGCELVIVGYDLECDGTNSGGNNGAGGVSGDTGSLGPPVPCTPVSSNTVAESSVLNGRLIIDVTQGGGSGGSGGSSGGTTPPPCPPDAPILDPCTQANALASNQAFVNKMNYLQTLKNTPGETTDLMEPNGTFNQQVSTANGGADQTFPISYFSGSTGFLHNHGNGLGIISVFTANDIASLHNIVTNGNVSNSATYTYGLVNQHGQSYLLMISNMSNFNNWASNYTLSDAPSDIFLSLYNNLINPSNTDANNENNLAILLSTTNSGLTLMKGNPTNNGWSQILRNSDGTISIIQCPAN